MTGRLTAVAGARRGAIALAALAAGTAAFTGVARAATIDQYAIGGPVAAIAAGPDESVWFSDPFDGVVGRITPAGEVVKYPVQGYDLALTAGPDGNMWAANEYGGVERITPDGGVTDFPGDWDTATNITTGPDGNIWFSSNFNNVIERVAPAGQITKFPLPDGTNPGQIVTGPDGNLWFAQQDGQIGRIATDGTLQPSLPSPNGGPIPLASTSDAVLFADGNDAIASMSPNGTLTEHAAQSGDGPYGVAAGSDGNLWFTSPGNDRVGRITPDGVDTDYVLPPQSAPAAIAAGPDGALWFTESDNRIGRLLPDGQLVSDVHAAKTTSDSTMLYGNVVAAAPQGWTDMWFEYGTTKQYGLTSWRTQTMGSGGIHLKEELVQFLKPGTTYHYRLVASSSLGTVTSDDYTFTTLAGSETGKDGPTVGDGTVSSGGSEAPQSGGTDTPRSGDTSTPRSGGGGTP